MTGSHAARTAGKIAFNGSVSIAAVLTGFWWAASHGIDFFDLRYARAEVVREHIAASQFQRWKDSTIYVEQLNDIRRDVRTLIADCQRRGGCPQ